MPIPKKIINFLEKNKIKYEIIKHRIVYTAFDKAQTLKRGPLAGGWRVGRSPEKIVGKTLVIKIDRDFVLALIPANKILDKGKFKRGLNDWRKKAGQKPVKTIGFATEAWMKKNLKGIKVGAIPPFGNLWGVSTFVSRSLINQPKIIINGGDYQWSIKIKSSDFKKVVPDSVIGNFSSPR